MVNDIVTPIFHLAVNARKTLGRTEASPGGIRSKATSSIREEMRVSKGRELTRTERK